MRSYMRGKKWWWALWAWLPDMVIQNAWIIYRIIKKDCDPKHDLLSFRREIANTLLSQCKTRTSSTTARTPRGRILSAERRVSIDVRYDGFMHFQEKFDVTKRCAVCKNNTMKGCNKCGVGCHDHCFKIWHGLE